MSAFFSIKHLIKCAILAGGNYQLFLDIRPPGHCGLFSFFKKSYTISIIKNSHIKMHISLFSGIIFVSVEYQ